MLIDLPNRVDNLKLPKSRPLLPLFEAISNSIDAIYDTKNKGRIDIHVHRDKQQTPLDGSAPPNDAIVGLTIEDNGIGFTEPNYQSFCTSDSSRKRASGGKGIGRLSWLWAFDHAEIESVFKGDSTFALRTFRFERSKDGVSKHKLAEVPGEGRKTVVRLIRSTPIFRKNCPKTAHAIGLRVIEHFLQMFAAEKCPAVYIHDDCEDEPIHLNKIFKDDVRLEEKLKEYKVDEEEFSIRHVRLSKIANGHEIHFCARGRSVRNENAVKWITNLKAAKLDALDGGEPFHYAAYVSSPLLEERLVADRNSFEIPREADMIDGEDEISWERVVKAAAKSATTFLAKYTAPARKAKREWIEEYAQRHPKYRPLIKHRPEWLDAVPFNLSDEELEVHLYKINQQYDLELKKQGQRLESAVQAGRSLQSFRKKLDGFLEQWNEAGKAKLCDYVVHRKATLSFLEDCLKRTVEDDSALEDVIHDTIFPMRTTSDDFGADASNLWVIDERLAFHHYLASDKQLKSVGPVKVAKENGLQRSDLIVFHRFDTPTVIVDSEQPFNSITIIEFKRPGRDDYKAGKNPIDQVDRYISDIQAGTVKDRYDRLIQPRPGTPYYTYIVCSITPSLKKLANMRGFIPTPDGQGYMKMHPTLSAYQEIISYEKLLSDANRRNKAFFDKLSISNK